MAVYGFQRSGLKTGVENNIFWSEIGSGFGLERGSTLPPRIPRSKPPPPCLTETCLRFGVNGAIVQKGFWDQFRFLGNCPPTPAGYKRMLFFFLVDTFQKVDNIHRVIFFCVFLHFLPFLTISFFVLVRHNLFRLCIAVNAIF